jgi:hypothetical protein
MLAGVRLLATSRHSRHRDSRLQLSLELVEKTPVGAVGDDLIGCRVNHAKLVQPEAVEPQRILRVELAPDIVGYVRDRLERRVVVVREAILDQLSCGTLRLGRAHIRCHGSANRKGYSTVAAARWHCQQLKQSGFGQARPPAATHRESPARIRLSVSGRPVEHSRTRASFSTGLMHALGQSLGAAAGRLRVSPMTVGVSCPPQKPGVLKRIGSEIETE